MSMVWGASRLPKKLAKPRTGTFAVLDIGTSKMCCLIARAGRPSADGNATPSAQPRVIGAGHQLSRGLKNGTIIDIDAAADAIRKAVHMSEQMAQETIGSVTVNLSTGAPQSEILGVDVDIGGQQIDEWDLHRVFQQTHAIREEEGTANGNCKDRELIHSIPVGFAIDGQKGIDDPRGMFGQKLSVNMHLVSASANAVRTIRAAVERCHLEIEGFVLSPFAAGLATLVEDEADLGVTVVDMGGGTTSLAIFYDGQMMFADTIPVGGNHVTSDVARGLSTTLANAERLKTFYGNAVATESDEHDLLDVPQVGEEDHNATVQMPRSLLNGIIQPRIEEIFELTRARLDEVLLLLLRVALLRLARAHRPQQLRQLAQRRRVAAVRERALERVHRQRELAARPEALAQAVPRVDERRIELCPLRPESGGEAIVASHAGQVRARAANDAYLAMTCLQQQTSDSEHCLIFIHNDRNAASRIEHRRDACERNAKFFDLQHQMAIIGQRGGKNYPTDAVLGNRLTSLAARIVKVFHLDLHAHRASLSACSRMQARNVITVGIVEQHKNAVAGSHLASLSPIWIALPIPLILQERRIGLIRE